MNIIFIRHSTGCHTTEFFSSCVEYKILGNREDFLSLIDSVGVTNGKFRIESKYNCDSPCTLLINNNFTAGRIFVSERPVLIGSVRKMEVIFSGNENSFQNLFNVFKSWLGEIAHDRYDADLKLDGIFDTNLIPFSVGIRFVVQNKTENLMHEKNDFLFPVELDYMSIDPESDKDYEEFVSRFQQNILSRVVGIK